MNAVADRLLAAIEARHLTDEEAAAYFGVTQSTFTRWKNGRVVPPLKRAAALAEFMAMDRAEVLALLADSDPTGPDLMPRVDALEAAVRNLDAKLTRLTDVYGALRAELGLAPSDPPTDQPRRRGARVRAPSAQPAP
jgi:transcriptional regulator with XRE-family HTH domain